MVYPVSRLSRASTIETAMELGRAIADPLRHLVDCHDRIEEHLQMLERAVPHLGAASEEERREARQALEKAMRFLAEMGHLHTVD